MSTRDNIRQRMIQNRHQTRNRQQSLLTRAAADIGLEPSDVHGTRIQGKLSNSVQGIYNRSHSAMS
ncbi:MAG: hypothetical protein AAFU71_13435 [Cyanobacteria bacterium J06632_22]